MIFNAVVHKIWSGPEPKNPAWPGFGLKLGLGLQLALVWLGLGCSSWNRVRVRVSSGVQLARCGLWSGF